MYMGSLPVATNRATYHIDFQLFDDETDEGIDLTGAVITLEVKRDEDSAVLLSATTTNGKIVVTDMDEGNFELVFTEDNMRSLDPKTYHVGITIEQSGETIQYLKGTLPVLHGVVD